MTGDEKLGNRIAGDAATGMIRSEDAVAEEVLPEPLPDLRHPFGRTIWVRRSNLGDGRHFDRGGGPKKHQFRGPFDLHRQLRMGVELVPDFPVRTAGVFQPADTTRPFARVQRRKIAEFHGHAAGRSSHCSGSFFDKGIALVELTEGKLAIEVESYKKMFPRPLHRMRNLW